MKTAGYWSVITAVCCFSLAEFAAAQTSVVTLAEGTRISLQLNDYLSTKLNSEGDRFSATVTVPVYENEKVVIPKGSIITGSVSRILRPGRFKGKAVMNLLFHALRIPGQGEFPVVASLASVNAEGNSGVKAEGTVEGKRSIGKDAGRVAKPGLTGAGLGALVGGGRGAVIGSGVGAAVGLATVFTTRGKDLEIRRGSMLEVALDRSLDIPLDGAPGRDRSR
jgi:hypothetical protein